MDNKKLPPTFIITAFNSIRKFFLRLSKKMTPPGMHIFELVQGFWLAKAIGVASSLRKQIKYLLTIPYHQCLLTSHIQ